MFVVLLVGVIVLVNAVGQKFKFRLDLTSDDRYTLSPATRDLLRDLPEAVTVTAYFTEDLPPQFATARQEFKDLLVEYSQRSNGNVAFEFIDPAKNDTLKQAAERNGIRPLVMNVQGKNKAEQLLAYMGAVVKMGDRRAVIPVVQPGTALEWTLSSNIKQVSVTDKPTIGLVQGHGEVAMGGIAQALQGLNVLYNVEPVTFWDTLPVHARFSSLLFIAPSDTIKPEHLHWLDEFLASGRGVVIALNSVHSDLGQSPIAEARSSDMSRWLASHGVQVQPTIITDAQCGQVQVMQQRGMFTMQIPISFPYFPLIQGPGFGDHPVSSGLEAVVMQFASPMTYAGDSSVTWTPVLMTSAKSNALPSPAYIDVQKQWTDADFPMGPQTIGAALEGRFTPGAKPARLVVFSNGTFSVGEEGQQRQQLNPDNVNLLVNAVDWISDETGLIELRNKGVNYRPIEELTEGEQSSIKWINLLLPLALAVLYGLLRAQWRKRQRLQRMLPDHVQ